MKKHYNELIQALCNFHNIALLDRKNQSTGSRWYACFDSIAHAFYNRDYAAFIKDFDIYKPVIMMGTLEAHYNFLNAVIEYNRTLTNLDEHRKMLVCAEEVLALFNEFLYHNKYQLHESENPKGFGKWFNINPLI